MNARFPIATALLGATLMLTGGCSPPPREAPPLAGASIGGPFTLTAGDGHIVHDTDFAGQYRLMYFGYSFCPDVCPVDLNALMLGLRAFERRDPARAARVQPLFVTLDPERDTAPVVRAYAAHFHPRLIGLTGTQPQIDAVAREFLVSFARQPGATPASYLIAHARMAYLLGPRGEPIALLPTDDPATDVDEGAPDQVAAELARWVR